jgi:hypothetical protein
MGELRPWHSEKVVKSLQAMSPGADARSALVGTMLLQWRIFPRLLDADQPVLCVSDTNGIEKMVFSREEAKELHAFLEYVLGRE